MQKYSGKIKHYVINLDRAKERRLHIEEQFQKLGLEMVRVSAIDANCLTAEDLSHYQRGAYRLLYDTEIACFLSHRHCWQAIADGEEGMATVFEDDVYLSHLFVDFLTLRPWSKDIQLLSLEKIRKRVRMRLIHEEPGFQTYRVFGFNMCAGGYLLTKAQAKFLLEETQYFYCPVANFLFDPRHLMSQIPNFRTRSYQVNPALCVQGRNHAQYEDFPTQQTTCRHFSSQVGKNQKDARSYIRKMKNFIVYIAHKTRSIASYVRINYID